jgi:hypothetical protein
MRLTHSSTHLRDDVARWQTLAPLEPPRPEPEPAPPPALVHAVERPGVFAAALRVLLQDVGSTAIDATVLHGFAGTGKTALAVQLCRDERVRNAFPDGVVWVRVGVDVQDPRPLLEAVQRALGGLTGRVDSVERARGALATLLERRSVLVVLDDVWTYGQVAPFVVDAPRSRLLVTSRTRVLGPELGARQLEVPAMTSVEAAELLAKWAGRSDPAMPAIAERLHRLPIALRVAGALLVRETSGAAWLARLEHASRITTSTAAAGDRDRDVAACLDLSVHELAHERRQPPGPDDRPLYDALGIFEQDIAIPCAVIERLWRALEPGRPAGHGARLFSELDELGLVDRAGDAIAMHDLLVDHCRVRLGGRFGAMHERLLASYRPDGTLPWSSVADDGYLYEHLAWHLAATRGPRALAELLRRGRAGHRRRNRMVIARAAARRPGARLPWPRRLAADAFAPALASRRHARYGLMLGEPRAASAAVRRRRSMLGRWCGWACGYRRAMPLGTGMGALVGPSERADGVWCCSAQRRPGASCSERWPSARSRTRSPPQCRKTSTNWAQRIARAHCRGRRPGCTRLLTPPARIADLERCATRCPMCSLVCPGLSGR